MVKPLTLSGLTLLAKHAGLVYFSTPILFSGYKANLFNLKSR
ncbi:hypothetical protein PALI_a1330 [Pseudoalteromonas aliena SW19]|uniref:Uncharacterized protein n=1 Tax=Pseudoalteromonas aliena SW19 TaxID=1314866 RepID=A0ABR9E0T8_9GAMM|nr:hypothetical protein [Pseudoalteromonas aliena SW19]